MIKQGNAAIFHERHEKHETMKCHEVIYTVRRQPYAYFDLVIIWSCSCFS
jgi:hypothetical protein